MEKYRVPQRKVPATVLLRDGRKLEGALYVPESGPGGGPGSLTERLVDAEERFLPFAGPVEGCLLSKAWITSVWVKRDLAEPELPEVPAEHHVEVQLRLAGGTRLEGRVDYTMPPEKGRLLDYLNAAPRFMLLQGDDEVALVNREHIVEAGQVGPDEA